MVDEPRGDLAQAAVAGERQALLLEIGANQLLGTIRLKPGEAGSKRGSRSVAVRTLALGQPREQRMECLRPPEIMPQLEPPALGQSQGIEQRIEQGDVAEAQAEVPQPRAAYRLDREQHDLDIGAFLVALAEALDAGLAELARVGLIVALRLEAEGGAVIAIAGGMIGFRVAFEIKPRHRHGQVGPQAKLVAGEVGEDIGAASDFFADLVEEDVGGLDDRGRNLLVARPPEQIEQAGGLGFESLELFRRFQRPWLFTQRRKQDRHARPKCRASTNSLSLPGLTGQSSNPRVRR